MNTDYDIIIIGIGAMGSATACHLAQRNKKILGIDRFAPPHKMGSSHGQTRIIREAYFEDPQYVPIIQHSYRNWGKLEKEYGEQLYLQTGGLMMGLPGCEIVKGAKLSADLHQLPYEILNAKEIREKFPAFHPTDDTIAIWEPRAGILFPEKCIEAYIKTAKKNNADFLFNEPAITWEATNEGVCVTTSNGKYYAKQLLLTAGAWLKNFLPGLNVPLTVERQVLYWFEPAIQTDIFKPGKFPIFIWTPGYRK
ncbi:MAG: N-methyl-L-tryptophan oxidase [Bacteroidota bacterium]